MQTGSEVSELMDKVCTFPEDLAMEKYKDAPNVVELAEMCATSKEVQIQGISAKCRALHQSTQSGLGPVWDKQCKVVQYLLCLELACRGTDVIFDLDKAYRLAEPQLNELQFTRLRSRLANLLEEHVCDIFSLDVVTKQFGLCPMRKKLRALCDNLRVRMNPGEDYAKFCMALIYMYARQRRVSVKTQLFLRVSRMGAEEFKLVSEDVVKLCGDLLHSGNGRQVETDYDYETLKDTPGMEKEAEAMRIRMKVDRERKEWKKRVLQSKQK